ncbi:BA75_02984T0 [Komagataella pastoris]|uniref:enoyl-[acyl-carrier-protein] reductase n=1 Tax=Komagataella pastoris TaxID=4922 RepID=A0A1B2JAH9_PICPA|nr:BA75_02984T0 [Komagataella pastoris]
MYSSITARALVYDTYGEPKDVISVHKHEVHAPQGNEIVLQTLAAPINPSDINQVQGVYPSRPELTTELGTDKPSAVGGNEGLFKIVAVGDQVSNFQIGDWCIPRGVNYGTWRTHLLSTQDKFQKLDSSALTKTQAATIAVNPCTAYQMLTMYADLKKGDWFIQNGGNSQVGQYAIQIGKALGLQSISIVRDRPDIDELKQQLYDLGATKVITEKENAAREFGKTVKEWTGGKPIRLGLNCVGGENLTNMARKLGQDAVLLTYGGMSMKPVTLPTTLFIFKNLTAKGFWITENGKRDPILKEKTVEAVLDLYSKGLLKEVPVNQFKVDLESLTCKKYLETFHSALQSHGKSLIVYE